MREQGRHYERAFEAYLRANRIPYVAVDEARRALAPVDAREDAGDLKSFDFAVYTSRGPNLLVDIKGRRAPRGGLARTGRLQSWVTRDDVRSLQRWERMFDPDGSGAFRGAFVFMYWCDEQPADGLFHEVFEHRGRWYAVRTVPVDDYAAVMRPRSERWRTVHLPGREFERLAGPVAAWRAGAAGWPGAPVGLLG